MKVYGSRSLLNLPGHHSTAAIVAEVEDFEGYWRATLMISDCDRKVTLDLPSPTSCTDAEFENAMFKLDTIIESSKALQRGMRSLRKRSR